MGDHAHTGISRRQLIGRGAALTAAGTFVAGCGSSGSEESSAASGDGVAGQKGRTVIMAMHDSNPFFVPVKAGFEAFAEMAGWDASYVAPPKQETPAVVSLQQNALLKKPDAVIFSRIDTNSFDENIKRAVDQGIRVVLSNVASDGYEELGVGFVGQDFIPAGVVNGLEACKYAQQVTKRTDGLIVCGNFAPGNSAIEQRITGTRQGVEQYNRENGTSFATETLVTSSDQSEAIGRISAKHSKDRDAIVGWAMAGIDHQFVAQFATDKNVAGQFAIGGFDLIKPVLDGIKAGTIHWTLGQNPWAQGFVAAALAAMELDPGYPARDYDTGAEVVDRSNIDAVIEREARFA
jgi:ABC-type sugar transport system substrate-binding protein